MGYERELLKGNTDVLLLTIIKAQPTYGYQIIKELEKKSNGYFRFKEGTLYPALHRLEKANLIQGTWQTLPGEQERRYYHITRKGLGVLEQKLDTWQDFSVAIRAILEAKAAL